MKRAYTSRIFWMVSIAGVSAACILASLVAGYLHWRAHRYDGPAAEAGRAHGVDPALVMAVIRRESGFNPRAVGKAGEIGLMQVTAAAGLEWAEAVGAASFVKADLFEPETNVRAGAWYLGRAIRHWSHKRDPLPYALAEYNAGRSNATRWAVDDDGDPGKFLAAITYPGTRRYIEDVLDDYCGRAGADSNCMSYRRR